MAFPVAIFCVAGKHPDVARDSGPCEVPAPSRRLSIVADAHEWGHFGTFKTLARIRAEGFWWLGMSADVEAVLRRCPACQRDNAHRVLFHPALAVPTAAGVMHRIHMDLLKLPVSSDATGNKQYLLLFVCALSKFPVGFALSSKASVDIATALWQFICIFGTPLTIVSDNGSASGRAGCRGGLCGRALCN